VLNFIVTEFGLVETDFVSRSGNIQDYLKNDDQIIVPSIWSKNKTIEYGFPESKINVVSHGINPKIFYPSDINLKKEFKNNLGLDKDEYLFANMGSMTWNKGIDLIVEAFIILRQKYSHIRLLLKDQSNLYGIQSQNIISQVLSKKPHLNQHELLSSFILINTNLTMSQLRSIYAGADCYLSPYRAEGFNLTVLEALACGSDVIVTEGGATDDFCYHSSIGKVKSNLVVSEVLNKSKGGNNLYYLEPELDSLVEEMEKKILDSKSNNLETANHIREKYNWDRIAEKLHELII
jgi:glycosyltransferase involved in cell wall biosynthesis